MGRKARPFYLWTPDNHHFYFLQRQNITGLTQVSQLQRFSPTPKGHGTDNFLAYTIILLMFPTVVQLPPKCCK
jgi:hypothetical protein